MRPLSITSELARLATHYDTGGRGGDPPWCGPSEALVWGSGGGVDKDE